MSKINFFQTITLCGFVLLAQVLHAQKSPVVATTTDESYASTTVVFKTKSATDTDVLAALEEAFGMGDVVRIAVAPPKPAAAPVAAAAPRPAAPAGVSGAITVRPTAPNMATAAKSKSAPTVAVKAPALSAHVAPVVVKTTPATTAKTAARTTVAKATTAQTKPVAVPPSTIQVAEKKSVATPVVVRTVTAAKAAGTTAKPNKRNSNKGFSLFGKHSPKAKKGGKQRYRCYKF